MDYYSKFPVVKKTDGLSAHSLVRVVMILFVEFGIPMK